MKKIILSLFALCLFFSVKGRVWIPDNGDGTYKNPIIYADYSDPDVIRVNDDYYMVASSFNCQPGIPVLHSKDLVNWTIINHIYDKLPLQRYEKMQPGQGSWAPAIRYHKGIFYVYFCTPEDGLFMASASDPLEKWSLKLVQDVANWEDPCPFWDEDGQAYLIRGKVGAGPAILHKMSSDGTKLLDDGVLIYQDLEKQPVLEGFKFMDKRDGYYYFTGPAGGVATGWQTVFRSKNIYGPYEEKIVLHQGKTEVNGPHQGALVETQTGEWWFIHFQDKGVYGRIVHLQPVQWKNDWPVMGVDDDNDGCGEPVLTYKKPDVGKTYPISAPQTSDDFSDPSLGLQWQWQASAQKNWYGIAANDKCLRLNAISNPTDDGGLFYTPNILLQKFAAPEFSAVTKLSFNPDKDGDRAGLTIIGKQYTFLCLEKQFDGIYLSIYSAKTEGRKKQSQEKLLSIPINTNTIWLKANLNENTKYQYSYSLNGKNFVDIGDLYQAEQGVWIGAKIGITCLNPSIFPSKGYATFDFFDINH